jgi:XTP/dITP diphosphohydrolase
VGARDSPAGARKIVPVLLASSNQGKLREYRRMVADAAIELGLMPDYSKLPPFDESAPTFAENGVGKALHYSQLTGELVLADDSGLVVPALGGAPGVQSARYAGPQATDADRMGKLLKEMEGMQGDQRRARFVCVVSLACRGRTIAVTSDFTEGVVMAHPMGEQGFGYDPIFFSPELGHTFAESSSAQKDRVSHRGKAFRKILELFWRKIA